MIRPCVILDKPSLSLSHFISLNSGRDLIGVQNLMKKHQAVLAEINNHDSRIAAVDQAAQQMISEEHFAIEEIKRRISELDSHWNALKEKALQVDIYSVTFINILLIILCKTR